MKRFLLSFVFVVLVMLLTPLLSFKAPEGDSIIQTAALFGEDGSVGKPAASSGAKPTFYDKFRVKDAKEDKISIIDKETYIFGVVAAEMPALYEEEALKAQAVAAYTFACRRADDRKKQEYDVTTDPKYDQSYTTEAILKEKWGEKADEYISKIKKAVSDASDMLLCYNGGTALTVYHAISNGKTNSCKDVWGSDIEYLVPADSSFDKLAGGYTDKKVFSPVTVAERLKNIATLSGDEGKYFSDIKKTDSGLVLTLRAGDKTLKGSEIAAALDLRSASFDVEFSGGAYNFTVYGHGHGVGMSQVGANYMAKQGSTFKEILLHYYKGCEIKTKK